MKVFIVLGCLSFIDFTYASCQETLQDAGADVSNGNEYAAYSNQHLAAMQTLINSKGDNKSICSEGQATRMGAMQAARAYRAARKSYLSAVNECPSPNDSVAAKNADTMTTSFNTNAQLVEKFDNMLVANCNANRLTPLLNQP